MDTITGIIDLSRERTQEELKRYKSSWYHYALLVPALVIFSHGIQMTFVSIQHSSTAWTQTDQWIGYLFLLKCFSEIVIGFFTLRYLFKIFTFGFKGKVLINSELTTPLEKDENILMKDFIPRKGMLYLTNKKFILCKRGKQNDTILLHDIDFVNISYVSEETTLDIIKNKKVIASFGVMWAEKWFNIVRKLKE